MSVLHGCRIGAFRLLQKFGVHVTPNHFYEPIPDTSNIPEEFWDRPSRLIGVDLNEAGQLSLLEQFRTKYKAEFDHFLDSGAGLPAGFSLSNRSFGPVDAEILYCMIRHFRPNVVFEIGSGNSTFLSASALLKNRSEGGSEGKLVAVEPYPSAAIKEGGAGLTQLVEAPVQSVALSEFENLKENDILFIDSSHVLKEASDVQFEYLEVLPRLRKGVIVHVHDIFLPYHYPRSWVVDELRFWNEQYVLQAFLAFNRSFEVLWAGSYTNHTRPEILERTFASYRRNETAPGSFWFRRVS